MVSVGSRLSGWLRVLMPAACLMVIACTTRSGGQPVTELAGPTMGARWSAKLVGPMSADDRAGLERAVQATLARIEGLLSTWDPNSELSRFNASTSLERFAISPETADAFRWASTLSAETGGVMDPTLLPLIDAWGFGAAGATPPPDQVTVDALLANVGFALVDVDPAGAWVRKRRPGVRLTFSAFVPGYAADRIASLLAGRGHMNVLVDVGGELVARGRNSDGQPWQVAVEQPESDGPALGPVAPLDNAALSTSGDYRNFREIAGGRLPHILDPRTGRPVRHALASASVVADLGVRADALSTGLMVLGPEAAMTFARERGLAVLLYVRTSNGEFEVRASPAWTAFGTSSKVP